MSTRLIPVILIAGFLSGCVTTSPSPGAGGAVLTPAEELIVDIREATETACSFLPALDFVRNMLTADNGVFNSASTYASAICQAVVQPRSTTRRSAARAYGTVNGIRVTGKFV